MRLQTAITVLQFTNSLSNADDLNALIKHFDKDATQKVVSVGAVSLTHLDAEWGGDATVVFQCLNNRCQEFTVKVKVDTSCDVVSVQVKE